MAVVSGPCVKRILANRSTRTVCGPPTASVGRVSIACAQTLTLLGNRRAFRRTALKGRRPQPRSGFPLPYPFQEVRSRPDTFGPPFWKKEEDWSLPGFSA